MNKVPQYYRQESESTCSLAVLRMVLSYFGKNINEQELESKVEKDYGKHFKNLWNPTIAKLAREYGINTCMYARWPLFKKELMAEAIKDFEQCPEKMNINKYENKNDKDTLPEPLPLAYEEMFKAVQKGCKFFYGGLTKSKIREFLSKGYLIQTSIKLHILYPGKKKGFHSILVYDYKGDEVFYHDPYNGSNLKVSFERLVKASTDVGACIVYLGN